MTRLLLKHGADSNIQAGQYGTALEAAALECAVEAARLLLEQGADINIRGGCAVTALKAAAL